MKVTKNEPKILSNGEKEAVTPDVEVKTIDWAALFRDDYIDLNKGRRAIPSDVINYIKTKNNISVFEDEDQELKENINKLCDDLLPLVENMSNKEMKLVFNLISLGEYLFSSNHQHQCELEKLGIQKLDEMEAKETGELNSPKQKRAEFTKKLIIEIYEDVVASKGTDNAIVSIVVSRCNKKLADLIISNDKRLNGLEADKIRFTNDNYYKIIKEYKKV